MSSERLRRLRELLAEARADALVVSALPNIRYLTGFTGSNGLLLVTGGDAVLFTDGRYKIQAAQQVEGARVSVPRGALVRALIASVKRRRLGRLAFEWRRASFELYHARTEFRPARAPPAALGRHRREAQGHQKSGGNCDHSPGG